MLRGFTSRNGRLEQTSTGTDDAALRQATWIDLVRPSEEEHRCVEAIYRQPLPEPDEVEEIEATARFFEDGEGLHLHSYFLHRAEGRRA